MKISDFTEYIIDLPDDKEGKVVATLIKSNKNTLRGKAVLYIHGFIDYFFHPHVAEEFHKNDFDFYALDLRKSGRSILPNQSPYRIDDLFKYFKEIDTSIDVIWSKSNTELFLFGHSTGGLIASIYGNSGKYRRDLSGLILNSPFMAMPTSQLLSNLSFPLAIMISKVAPNSSMKNALSSVYPQSIHKDHFGEWDFNLKWKPIVAFPMYYEWVVGVQKAQRSLKKSDIKLPILVLYSGDSANPKKYSEVAVNRDCVLRVKDMKERCPSLGNDVTMKEIEGAKHDVFLSILPVRQKAFEEMFNWLNEL